MESAVCLKARSVIVLPRGLASCAPLNREDNNITYHDFAGVEGAEENP